MVRRGVGGVSGFHTVAHTPAEHTEIAPTAHSPESTTMELLGLLLFVLWVLIATICTILADGRGHTPDIRSGAPWSAGNLPSEPYASFRM